MTVYVDPPGSAPGQLGRVVFTCHMFADDAQELVNFARIIGLKPGWLQKSWPHFDLTAGKRAQAVACGAHELTREETVEKVRRLRR